MAVAVVSTSFREADILDLWIGHLLAEDVDLIFIADKFADDGSREILEHWKNSTHQVEWFDDAEESHRQSWWTDALASDAHDLGMDFVLPCDVDEFPYALSGETLGKTLDSCSSDKLFMQVWPHLDWNNRFVQPHRMSKVAYRWSPDAHVVMGSHDVTLPGGVNDVLAMRELQYRSFDHYVQKAKDRNATLEPAARARGDGWHHLRLESWSLEQMQQEWALMIAAPTIYDPIPTHITTTPS